MVATAFMLELPTETPVAEDVNPPVGLPSVVGFNVLCPPISLKSTLEIVPFNGVVLAVRFD